MLNIIDELTKTIIKMPGLGKKSSERIAFFLVKNEELRNKFINDLKNLKEIKLCIKCNNLSLNKECDICSNNNNYRDKNILCILPSIIDFYKIENLNIYKGYYFILKNELNKYNLNQDISLEKLYKFINENNFKEIVIATNPTLNGELTATKLYEALNVYKKIKITKLAYGLSLGLELENFDDFSIKQSFLNRKKY